MRRTVFRNLNKNFLRSRHTFANQQRLFTQRTVTNTRNARLGLSLMGAALGSFSLYQIFHADSAEKTEEKVEEIVGKKREGFPDYTKEDVAKHNSKENGYWVYYKEGVYDVTEFIESHPGGSEKILMGVGKSIEPYWALYNIHKTKEVYEILESYRIGNLKILPGESKEEIKLDDPYATDPERNPLLLVNASKPFNAETPTLLLSETFLTPNPIFFVRNHLPVPLIDDKSYKLTVKACDTCEEVSYTLEELKSKFKEKEVVATIQCAGNRRNELNQVKPVRGLNWTGTAISNGKWTGVSLRDVLLDAGFSENAQVLHVQFTGYDNDGNGGHYATSIPVEKAISESGDVLLAYKMNDEDLPLDHGFPLRVVVPGVAGARNVKWLQSVVCQKEEATTLWQKKDYKSFSPAIDWHNVNWETAPAIQELPVQSLICYPPTGSVISQEVDELELKGYAWSGGGHSIIRVDVTIDGENWFTADLEQQSYKYGRNWAWSLWSVNVPIPKDGSKFQISCRAVDDAYNTQPESSKNIWNLRGLLNNSWHNIEILRKNE